MMTERGYRISPYIPGHARFHRHKRDGHGFCYCYCAVLGPQEALIRYIGSSHTRQRESMLLQLDGLPTKAIGLFWRTRIDPSPQSRRTTRELHCTKGHTYASINSSTTLALHGIRENLNEMGLLDHKNFLLWLTANLDRGYPHLLLFSFTVPYLEDLFDDFYFFW